MKRTLITILFALGAIAGAAYILNNNKEQMQAQVELARTVNATIPVQVATVKQEQVGGTFSATGNFTPARELTVVTEASGKIIRLFVDEGEFVKKGQLLARTEYATLEADLKSAEANLRKLATDKERYERLVKTGGVTQAQLDEIHLAFVNAEARVINARKTLDDTYVRAPFAGYINKRHVEEGAYVTPGKQIFDIVDTSRLRMVVNVTERQVLQVNQAQAIKVHAGVYPGVTYEATVRFISAKADANLNFPVELEIKNVNDKPLRAGMFGRATFELPGEGTSLTIPRAALVGSLDNGQVFVVKGDSVVQTKVVTGKTFGNVVEVLDALNPGDQVVTTGQINLTDGARVTVLN